MLGHLSDVVFCYEAVHRPGSCPCAGDLSCVFEWSILRLLGSLHQPKKEDDLLPALLAFAVFFATIEREVGKLRVVKQLFYVFVTVVFRGSC